jgi:hypothetical protein
MVLGLSDGVLSWPLLYPSLVATLRMLAVLPTLISYVLVKRRNTLTFLSYSLAYLIALSFNYLITRTKVRPNFFVMLSDDEERHDLYSSPIIVRVI